MLEKKYYHHSKYPGGMSVATFKEVMEKDATKTLYLAIKGMLPKSKLGNKILTNLRIFPGEEHNLQAQKPVAIN